MTSQTLREARKYEEATSKLVSKEERPAFHLSPRIGWMNDPNGFSYYQGQYHMFYQYNPYSTRWDTMHWGHAVSKDLLHWEYLPAALAPDEPYDRCGVFSGSAIELPDGKQLLMYTGVVQMRDEYSHPYDIQTQCVAVGDGVDYKKYEKNPVLNSDALPEGANIHDFRDPKIWRDEEDGLYYCVVGNRPADKSGQILLYSSKDAFEWKFESILAKNENRYGKMWECPDFFEIDGKWVLLVSPQDMLPEGFEYHNGNGTLGIIGTYDKENKKFIEEAHQSVDYGIDFYAMQTVLTPDGRRVMIGWMQNWDTCTYNPEDKWYAQMSLPREIWLQNGRIYQKPLTELENLRANKVEYKDVKIEETIKLDGVSGRMVDMEITIRPEDKEDIYKKFVVYFAENGTNCTSLGFRPYESLLKIDRKFSGSRRAVIHQRRSRVNSEDGCLKMRIILDRFSAEIFVNDGEQVMTATIPTDVAADGISFWADGSVVMDIVKYDLISE